MTAAIRKTVAIIMVLLLAIGICFRVPKAVAQTDKYSKMAPVDQYLMERNAEILLARSAAPDSISNGATILVLGRQGYETAVRGSPLWRLSTGSPRNCRGRLEVLEERGISRWWSSSQS